MEILNSQQLIDKLDTQGITVFTSLISAKSDIYFSNSNGVDAFISFASDLNIKHMFIYICILAEDEIEYITDEILLEKEIPEDYLLVIKKETDKFNKNQTKLKEHIGEEQSIQLFFSHYGTIYSFIMSNDGLFPDDPEEFLDSILENNEDKIKEMRSKERLEKQIIRNKIMSELESEIIAHEHFKTCTNDKNRRNFAFTLYEEKEDFFNNNKIGAYEIVDFIGVLWSKHKDNFKKK